MESTLPMPVKPLRGFARAALEKGQEKAVTFELIARKDMRYYDARNRTYTIEPGEFEIQIGASSGDYKVDQMLGGYLRVITGYHETIVYQVTS
ncbi:MAG: fibronectin type III-like domain-contianing protein [Phycisphaerales bacterium]|nr:MAG: fibronectin type III-like domain-contianing protein [Phycisphaerales bacterium]